MDSQMEIDIIRSPTTIYCGNCESFVEVIEIQAKVTDISSRFVEGCFECPRCKNMTTWHEPKSEFVEKFQDYYLKKEIMARSEISLSTGTSECIKCLQCLEGITSITCHGVATHKSTFTGEGTAKCAKCDKTYTVTINDSLITSITPIDDETD